MNDVPRFKGEKLRLARNFNSLSQADLAKKVDVTRQYIHSLEIGDRSPHVDLLPALAFSLRVTPGFLTTPLPYEVKEEHCHFRARKTTTVTMRSQCIAHSTLFDALVTHLDKSLPLPPVDIPKIDAVNNDQVEAAANECRQKWRLGEGPISNMCRVLETRGAVITYFEGVSEKVDALSVSRPRPIVVRNPAKGSAARMRFDLAHELGHLVMHYGIETGDDETERQADRYASAFLLPRRPFVAEFPKQGRLDWIAMYNLKKRWGASVAAIIRRAFDLGLIDPAQYRIANINLSKTGQRKNEQYDEHVPAENPELLINAIEAYERTYSKTPAHLAEELGLKPSLLRKLTGIKSINVEEISNSSSVVNLGEYRERRS